MNRPKTVLRETISERERRLRRKLDEDLGPEIRLALGDDTVVEIVLNDDGALWVDRLGRPMELLPVRMDADRASRLVGTVAALLETVVNEAKPIVEGELPFYGARFQGLVPPVVRRPIFAIRKKALLVHTLVDYVDRGRLDPHHAREICRAVRLRQNIVVCGGTGSGKTTFTNALLREKVESGKAGQRIVVLEDTPELQCCAENTVALRSCEQADLGRLVRATMRLRPDAIVVGEVRGREALDLLKAWNTGHPGGVSTLHANGARAALSRIDQLVQEAGVPSQPHFVADAVDMVVALARRADGPRVTEVVHVVGFDERSRTYQLESVPCEQEGEADHESIR